jgi:hypothetical protein
MPSDKFPGTYLPMQACGARSDQNNVGCLAGPFIG